MMRFFWTILLPLSVTGGCAAVLLWLTRPLLYRMGQVHWPVRAVIAVLCLFVVPVHLFLSWLPAVEMPLPAPVPAQNAPASGAAVSNASLFLADGAASSAPAGAPSANAAGVAENAAGPVSAGTVLSAAARKILFLRVITFIWAAGMVLLLLCSAVSYLRFAVRLKRSSRAVTDDAMLESLRAAQKKSGAARLPGLRCTEAVASPLAMGVVRPCIYLPAGVPADASLDYALQHECVHLRKCHLFWKLAAQLVCTVHWFDPAAWLLPRLMNEGCEFDCDRTVTAALDGAQKRGYCNALLDAADPGRMPRCVSAFSRPAAILRKRIDAVLAPKPRLARRIVAAALCAALVLCAAGLTACAAGQAADSIASWIPAPLADAYDPLRAELDALCARDVIAYHYDMGDESGDVYCADGNWYCVTNRYTTLEYLAYQDTLYLRNRDPQFSPAGDAWGAVLPDTPGYTCEQRRGMYALSQRLPTAGDFDRVETDGAQTTFFYSRSALKALQKAGIESAEALVAQTSENGDANVWDLVQKNLDIAKHTSYTDGILTVSKNANGLESVHLQLILEFPTFHVDADGNLVWLDEKQSEPNVYAITVLDMDEDVIREQIAGAAALLEE